MACEAFAADLEAGAEPPTGRVRLERVARRTTEVPRPPAVVTMAVLVQFRTLVVSLLAATGLDDRVAVDAVPALDG